jgi:RNA polymerase sigma-70 factor (ECF subfamily)
MDIDPNVLQLFREGDEKAFKAIYDRLFFPIYQYARRWLLVVQDAQDITSDSFIKLYNRRSQFESIGNIEAFLRITVRNACFDHLRHIKVKTKRQEELIRELNREVEPDFAWVEIQERYMQLIYAAVEKLPEKMKVIFLLSFEEGLKPAEIADRLGVTARTVTNQKINAIQILRRSLEKQSVLLFISMMNLLDQV